MLCFHMFPCLVLQMMDKAAWALLHISEQGLNTLMGLSVFLEPVAIYLSHL